MKFAARGAEIVRIAGPVKDPAELVLLGEFVASVAYRSSKFADFRKRKRKVRGG